jgi:ribulose kinase
MQIYADVTGCTMLVAGSSQACALGAAIAPPSSPAPTRDFPAAQRAMTAQARRATGPIPKRRTYNRLYASTAAPRRLRRRPQGARFLRRHEGTPRHQVGDRGI